MRPTRLAAALAGIGQRWLEVERVMGIEPKRNTPKISR
jgi:hypothetical protein